MVKLANNNPLFLKVKKNKNAVISIIFFAIIVDVVFFVKSNDAVIFLIVGIYILAIKQCKVRAQQTFSFCILMLIIMYIQLILTKTSENTEKSAVWLFIMIIIGISQKLREKKFLK